MSEGLLSVSYLAAAILFILSLGGLSQHETAKRGNLFGIIGITIAIIATLATVKGGYGVLAITISVGAIVGGLLASRVEMTNMPQLVAILHSFVGMAAVLVGMSSYLDSGHLEGVNRIIHGVEIFIGVFIGAPNLYRFGRSLRKAPRSHSQQATYDSRPAFN